MTSFETARSLANGPIVAGGWGGIPRELQRLLSLIGYGSTGGVCGRSLTAGKILFTGRQTWSLYLVLWLCGVIQYRKKPHQDCLALKKPGNTATTAINESWQEPNSKFMARIYNKNATTFSKNIQQSKYVAIEEWRNINYRTTCHMILGAYSRCSSTLVRFL